MVLPLSVKIIGSFTFYMLITLPVFGQKNISNGNKQWVQYYNTIKLNDNWSLNSDLGLRWRNELEEVSQTLIRSGLGYQMNSQARLVAGFAFLSFHENGSRNKVEYRPYQEVNMSQSFTKIKISHRFRAEQRFFNSTNATASIFSFNHRFRYRFLMNVPLFEIDKNNRLVSINLGDEILINAGKEIEYNLFDANRVLIGPAMQVSRALNLSITYNYLFAQKNEPESFGSSHVLWIGIKHKIDFTH